MEKPDIALVLEGGAKKKMGPPGLLEEDAVGDMPAEEATDPSIVEAAGAVRAAMSSGDDEEFARTLKGFIQLCGDYS